MSGNISSDRGRLGFTERVTSSFSFLSEEYDFRVVKTEPTFVRYESSRVFVNIYHGRASFELGFEIGRLDGTGKEESAYTLSMIIEHMGAQKTTGYTSFQCSTGDSLKQCVPKLAGLVQNYASSFLTGDPGAYTQLLKTRSDIGERITKDYKLRAVREKAIEAWLSRDYAQVADLYESIFEDLTPAEIKKLDYSKKILAVT
jgi:hypothetical protein